VSATTATAFRFAPRLAIANGTLQLGFAAFVALALLAGAGRPLRLVYPILAVGVGVRLLLTSTPDYVRFVLWLWTLTPLVRRIADFQAGWQDPSLVLLTPYLVTSSAAVHAVIKTLLFPAAYRPTVPPGLTMFLLARLGAAIGIPVGFATGAPGAVIETLNWIVPLVFGGYIASCADEREAIEDAVVSTFGLIAPLAGAYAVYQFFSLPGWDANWMLNSEMKSIGSAEALAVRVFSTMHSPGVLGYFIVVPIVTWLAQPIGRGVLPACLALVALLLSQVRTAWLAFAVAAILVVLSLRLAAGIRVLLLVTFGLICVTPFLQIPDVSERVSARIESLRDLPSYDESAVSRIEGHRRVFVFMAAHPFGAGIGADPVELKDTVGMRDGFLVAGLIQFGFIGAVLHVLSLLVLSLYLWTYYYRSISVRPQGVGLAAVGMGFMVTLALGIPTIAPVGVILWLVGGLAAAHERAVRQEGRHGARERGRHGQPERRRFAAAPVAQEGPA